MPDGIPFPAQRLREGPFDFPPPPDTNPTLLFKSLYKLLNYLAVEWCGGDLPAHLRVAFGPTNADQCFDLAIIISNSDLHIKKHKLDEVFAECHVLHPFLDINVTTPSVMVTGSLSSYIKHFHKLWATPRGVLVQEQPLLSRKMTNSSVLYIFINFRCDIRMKEMKDLMSYYLLRLNIGCSENLNIDLKYDQVPHLNQFHFPGHYKSGVSNPTRSDGSVNVKICRACQSCRVQTTKPKEITIKDHKFNVKICTRQCFGEMDNRCADKRFKGKLTILGPGSVPILHQSDDEFYNQFNKLVQRWPCMYENLTHLILIFECVVTKENVHTIMELLHETCFQVFSKYQSSFKSSVSQLLGKSPSSSGITVDLATASKNLARGISEIVELSKNDDFKKNVKDLLPYDTMETLQEAILNKSRQFGLREPRIVDTASVASVEMVEPCSKRRKIVPAVAPAEETPGVVSVGGFHFTATEQESVRPETRITEAELSDFESLQ